jgi:hypothetical protein
MMKREIRLDVVSETYKNGEAGKPIRGISQLKFLFVKYNNENNTGHFPLEEDLDVSVTLIKRFLSERIIF